MAASIQVPSIEGPLELLLLSHYHLSFFAQTLSRVNMLYFKEYI